MGESRREHLRGLDAGVDRVVFVTPFRPDVSVHLAAVAAEPFLFRRPEVDDGCPAVHDHREVLASRVRRADLRAGPDVNEPARGGKGPEPESALEEEPVDGPDAGSPFAVTVARLRSCIPSRIPASSDAGMRRSGVKMLRRWLPALA